MYSIHQIRQNQHHRRDGNVPKLSWHQPQVVRSTNKPPLGQASHAIPTCQRQRRTKRDSVIWACPRFKLVGGVWKPEHLYGRRAGGVGRSASRTLGTASTNQSASCGDGLLRRDREHLVSVLCDEHHVLELRRPAAVHRLHGPRVRPQRGRLRTLREDRLYREGHAGY